MPYTAYTGPGRPGKMGQINIMKLINAIKIRPALYNKEDTMYYSHKKFKYKLWREVCQEVYKNWGTLAPHEKLEYARELQKRWKSLRTCFTRELALQKKEKLKKEKNESFKRRKKYEYFNFLTFLLNPENVGEYTGNNSESEEDPLDPDTRTVEYSTLEVQETDSDHEINTRNNSDNFKASNSSQIKLEASYDQPIEFEKPSLDDKLLDVLRDSRGLENDEDRMFALSLVSIFKNLNPRKKIEARIEVLKLLHSISYRDGEMDH